MKIFECNESDVEVDPALPPAPGLWAGVAFFPP